MSIYTNPTLLASLTRGSSALSTPSSSVLPITSMGENASLYAPTPPPKEVPSPAQLSQSPFTSSKVVLPSHRRTRSTKEIIQKFEAMGTKPLPPKHASRPQRLRLNALPAIASHLDGHNNTSMAIGNYPAHSRTNTPYSQSDHADDSHTGAKNHPKISFVVSRQEKVANTDKPYRLPRLLSPLSRARTRPRISRPTPVNLPNPSTPPGVDHLKTGTPSVSSLGSIKASAVKPSTSSSSGGMSGVKNSFQALLNVFGGGKRKKKMKNAEDSNEGELGFTVDRSGKAVAIRPSSSNVCFNAISFSLLLL